MKVIDLHREAWANLLARRDRLPHALLVQGQRGLGKFRLARAFAAWLLCENTDRGDEACGNCLACRWFEQGNHPDFRLVQPEALTAAEAEAEESKKKPSQQITIEQIRGLDDFFNIGTHRSGLRIILIHPAESMNRPTANSLLKTLEEPAPGTLFLLVCNEPMRLLPTIRSRCQTLALGLPAEAAACAALAADGIAEPARWLALAGGAPFLAAELAESELGALLGPLTSRLAGGGRIDPLAAAAELEKLIKASKGTAGIRQIVEWTQKWAVDLVLIALGRPVRYFVGQRATIRQLAERVPVHVFIGYYRKLANSRREAEQPLNVRLFLEAFFMDYRALF